MRYFSETRSRVSGQDDRPLPETAAASVVPAGGAGQGMPDWEQRIAKQWVQGGRGGHEYCASRLSLHGANNQLAAAVSCTFPGLRCVQRRP